MSARFLRIASTSGAIAVALASFNATTVAAAADPAPNRPDSSGTVWLCRPGLADDPCTANQTATLIRGNGKRTAQRVKPPKDPPIDCFYVYPTVSRQKTPNANLHIDPEETAVAVAQASRFSQVCNVYVPMYPQLTTSGIGLGGAQIDPKTAVKAYLGVLSAWNDYLAHDNHGRGVVLIGHSQGSSLLIPLIRNQIDANVSERRLLISALLMGGNVTVPVGQTVGGSFQHIPACRSDSETGCVVAYSSFNCDTSIEQFLRPGRFEYRKPFAAWNNHAGWPRGPLHQSGRTGRRCCSPRSLLCDEGDTWGTGKLEATSQQRGDHPVGQLPQPL